MSLLTIHFQFLHLSWVSICGTLHFLLADAGAETIDATRVRVLSECCNMLQSLIDKYLCSRQTHCPCRLSECDATVLGGLQRALKANKLLPLPGPPFTGLSIKTFTETLRNLQLPSLCKSMHNPHGYSGHSCSGGKRCGVVEEITNKMREMEERPKGLSLDEESFASQQKAL